VAGSRNIEKKWKVIFALTKAHKPNKENFTGRNYFEEKHFFKAEVKHRRIDFKFSFLL
jgi:hypothetical protein